MTRSPDAQRARTHITTIIEVLREGHDPATLVISGMITGLCVAVRIIDGAKAEDGMAEVEAQLAASIGRAYLDGSLTATPPEPTT